MAGDIIATREQHREVELARFVSWHGKPCGHFSNWAGGGLSEK
jgi:hypothetical protein